MLYETFDFTLSTINKAFIPLEDVILWKLEKCKRILQYSKTTSFFLGNIQIAETYLSELQMHNNIDSENKLQLHCTKIVENFSNEKLESVTFTCIKTKELEDFSNQIQIKIEDIVSRSISVPVGLAMESSNITEVIMARLNAIDLMFFQSIEKKTEYVKEKHINLSNAYYGT